MPHIRNHDHTSHIQRHTSRIPHNTRLLHLCSTRKSCALCLSSICRNSYAATRLTKKIWRETAKTLKNIAGILHKHTIATVHAHGAPNLALVPRITRHGGKLERHRNRRVKHKLGCNHLACLLGMHGFIVKSLGFHCYIIDQADARSVVSTQHCSQLQWYW